jgi:hypothetical protein
VPDLQCAGVERAPDVLYDLLGRRLRRHGFFLISTSMWGQDELQTLRYAIKLNCSMGADGG